MGRTQVAVLEGTARCLVAHGARRTTMVDIAAAAGVAKGTLYNHVRTRAEAYRLLADEETARLVGLLTGEPPLALAAAADFVATHPVVRRFARDEPAALAVLLTPGPWTEGPYGRVAEALEDLLGPERAPLGLRLLLSLLGSPGSAEERAALAVLVAGPPTEV